MKKAFKRTTAAIMAAMILATTATTVTVFATETTGTTENGSPSTGAGATVSATKLPEAVNGVITLQNDVTISYSDWVALKLTEAGTNVTIDLNGNTLTYTNMNTVEVDNS